MNKALERRIRQQVQAREHLWRAEVHLGFQPTALREVNRLAKTYLTEYPLEVQGEVEFSANHTEAVYWRGRLESAWVMNRYAKTIRRIYVQLSVAQITNFSSLNKHLQSIPWELWLADVSKQKLLIKVRTRQSRLYHKKAIQQRVEEFLKPLQLGGTILVEFNKDQLSIWLDSSGERLSRRGYDKYVSTAPLEDTLAASLLQEGVFRSTQAGVSLQALIDPMAGSGSFTLESLLNSSPGEIRSFAFMNWPSFREKHYQYICQYLPPDQKEAAVFSKYFCSDLERKNLEIIQTNLSKVQNLSSPFADLVQVQQQDFFQSKAQSEAFVFLNPPYGQRLKTDSGFFNDLQKHLQAAYAGCFCVIIYPADQALRKLLLEHKSVIRTRNAGLSVQVVFGMIPKK
jgi:putative N6-adenine-specific DNA methylase